MYKSKENSGLRSVKSKFHFLEEKYVVHYHDTV